MVTFSCPSDCDDSLTDSSDTDSGLRHSSSDSSAQGSNNNNSNNNNTTSGAGTNDDAEQRDKACRRTTTRFGLWLDSSTADEGCSSLESSFSSQQGANNNNNNSPYGLSSSYNSNDRESLESNSAGTTYTDVEEASSATSSLSSLSMHDPNRTQTNHNALFSPVAWAPDPNMFGGNNNNNNDNDNNNENENGNDENNNNNINNNNVHPDALASGNDVEEDETSLMSIDSSLEEPFHFECLNEPCWSSSITISTTMRSFLPNKPFINATVCCGNSDCDNKEAETEIEAEAERSILLDIICPGCRSVHYCSVDCQETHSKNHKQQCNQHAEDMKEEKERLEHNHNKENTDNDDDNDNELFQAIPSKDDCPICNLPFPIAGSVYMPCCTKLICKGCNFKYIQVTREKGRQRKPPCAFCRAPASTSDDEIVNRMEKRMEMNNSAAIFMAFHFYHFGKYGLPKDPKKAFDLCLLAAELKNVNACCTLAILYEDGVGVVKDMIKARKYNEMAVMKGNIKARYHLGVDEWNNNNNYRLACRHLLISAAAGHAGSLEAIACYYQYQFVTKEEYSTALTSYIQVHKDEWSIEREAAAAAERDETTKFFF